VEAASQRTDPFPGMQEEAAQMIDELIAPVEFRQLHPILASIDQDPISSFIERKTPTSGGKQVDLRGFEPLTSSVRLRRAPNCATGPFQGG
jgi:hypothetical protein